MTTFSTVVNAYQNDEKTKLSNKEQGSLKKSQETGMDHWGSNVSHKTQSKFCFYQLLSYCKVNFPLLEIWIKMNSHTFHLVHLAAYKHKAVTMNKCITLIHIASQAAINKNPAIINSSLSVAFSVFKTRHAFLVLISTSCGLQMS